MKNSNDDKAWIDTSNLHNNNLRINLVNRTTRQGGEIALLHRKEYITTRLETSLQLDTIKHGVWSTTIGYKKLTLVGIYHPPIGSTTSNTHTRFLEEVHQLIQFLITSHTNLVLLGDINIHTQDRDNPGSLIYNDTMEALELQQHIDKPMHKIENTLDLIYTESLNSLNTTLFHRYFHFRL